MIGVGLAVILAFSPLTGTGTRTLSAESTPQELLQACRQMMPQTVKIKGHINRRSRHGIEVAAYRYVYTRQNGEVRLTVMDKDGQVLELKPEGRLLDTDVTWSDLTLDYLDWEEVSNSPEGEMESIQTVKCRVLDLKKGSRLVRVWIDCRTGALMQAEEWQEGKVIRRLFGTSIRKFGDRWAPRTIEVGRPGAKYRTKIVVDELK